jgi:hypothetical protein
MYIDVSSIPFRDKARLLSPKIDGSGSYCLTLWYHMYGATVDTMSVYFASGPVVGQALWSKTGTQGNKWMQASIQYTPIIGPTVDKVGLHLNFLYMPN